MFRDKVYKICKNIPKGNVSTYKAIAHILGTKAYRAVGNALNKNRNKDVPCHRVVGSNGNLVGFAKGIKIKAKLLMGEGVIVRNNRIDLERYFHRLR